MRPMKGIKMSNEEYFKNIYNIKFQIDKLTEDFYALPWSQELQNTYNAELAKLQSSLEEAYNAK
jgi:hypothetical protein